MLSRPMLIKVCVCATSSICECFKIRNLLKYSWPGSDKEDYFRCFCRQQRQVNADHLQLLSLYGRISNCYLMLYCTAVRSCCSFTEELAVTCDSDNLKLNLWLIRKSNTSGRCADVKQINTWDVISRMSHRKVTVFHERAYNWAWSFKIPSFRH